MPTATSLPKSLPSSLPSSLRDPRAAARRTVRRHRRPLAAALAGLATLLALTTLRGASEAPSSAVAGSALTSSTAVPGHVTVPVTLTSGAIAAVLQVGDVIDLVGSSDSAASIGDPTTPVTVIARGARVIDLPIGGSALGGTSSAVILVSLPEADALRVVTSMRDGLTPVIRSR